MPNNSQRSAVEGVPLLIELLYGFAIANGLAEAAKSILISPNDFDDFTVIFFATAFFMAIEEWLMYHLVVAKVGYHDICDYSWISFSR